MSSKLLFSFNTVQPEWGRHTAMFIVCSLFHPLLKAVPEVTETQQGLKDPGRERTQELGLSRGWLPERLATGSLRGWRVEGQEHRCQPHSHMQWAAWVSSHSRVSLWLPKVRTQRSLCFQHLLDVMRAKPKPSCHLVRWAGPCTGWVESRALVSVLPLTAE